MKLKIRPAFFFCICIILKLCIYSQSNFVFDSSSVQIKGLNINTREAEFGPFKVGNKLYFTSSRERHLGVINLDRRTDHQLLDIYSADMKDSITLKGVKPLNNDVNNSFNQGSSFFDREGSKLYYAGNVIIDKRTDKHKLAIFSTEYKGNKYLKSKVELVLPDTFSVSHPMLYKNKLYFSSNLIGGKGKVDLYSAEQFNGKWTNLTNLKDLNSQEDDYFPYVINENEIYFSSNRAGGFGKLDLYKYTLVNDTANIQNLGPPINSKYDDYGVYIDTTQESGYFTTTRNNNQDDIYYFGKTWPTFNNCVQALKETYCFDLTDERALDSDTLNGFFYEWDFGDGEKQKGISVTHCYSQPGDYLVNLNIIDVSTKAVFLNQTAVDLHVDSITQLKVNALDTILVNKKITINTVGTYLPEKKINRYYFEVEGKRFTKSSFEYVFTKMGKYRIKLGVDYNDLKLKTKGLMCSFLDVNVVDNTKWLSYEDRKIKELASRFDLQNMQADTSRLKDLNEDAELAYFSRLGLNKEKVKEKITEALSSKNYQKQLTNDTTAISEKKREGFNNIDGTRNLLSSLDEELNTIFKVHIAKSKTKMDTMQLKAKGINGIKEEFINNEYIYSIGSKGKAKDIESYYNQAVKAGISNPEIFVYKDSVPVELNKYSAEQNKKKKNPENALTPKDDFSARNIGGNQNGLSDLSEELDVTFKVLLAKSKTKIDTAQLNAKGIYGIKEEFVEDAYVYSIGNTGKPKDAERYYNQALKAGIANPEIFVNKDNKSLALNDYVAVQNKKMRGQENVLPQRDDFSAKNIGGNQNGLSDLDEELDVIFKVRIATSKTKMDTTALNAKGVYGIKEEFINDEYVYSIGNKGKKKEAEMYYNMALKAGVENPKVYAYKNDSVISSDYLASKSKIAISKSDETSDLLPRNINGFENSLSDLHEDLDISFKVHLGKSKIKSDTTFLHQKGMVGITEEVIKSEYNYTYGNEKKVKNIEKYYKKALEVGVKKPIVVAYKNNVLLPNQLQNVDSLMIDATLSNTKKIIHSKDTATSLITASAAADRIKLLQSYGNVTIKGLKYFVQVGAYRKPQNYKNQKLTETCLVKQNGVILGDVTLLIVDKQFDTWLEAEDYLNKVKNLGQSDAFLTALVDGKRVYLKDLLERGIWERRSL
jgi:hypothetical protein